VRLSELCGGEVVTDLRTLAEAARDAIAAHAALNEDDAAEGAAFARKEAAVEELRDAVTPDVVLALVGPTNDPAALRAKALASDAQLLTWWRSVQGPHAGLTGPLIRFAGLVRDAALLDTAAAYDALVVENARLRERALPLIDPEADDTMGKEIPITQSRLFDLVRYARYWLQDEGVISMGEWTWLVTASTGPQPGSPSRVRLEENDQLRADRDALAARVAERDESSRFHQERARQAEAEVERLRKVLDAAAPHICPTCGPHAKVDEDGCCRACGADTHYQSNPYVRTFTAKEVVMPGSVEYPGEAAYDAELQTTRAALRALLANPHGCRFCDSGELRREDRSHDDDCPYLVAGDVLGEDVTPVSEPKR
jgi:hypothetical protein